MGTASLLTLPVEVRLNIWNYAFADEWIYIDPCTYGPVRRQQRQRQYGAPITRLCRLLRYEAEPCYYRNVRIHFDVCKSARPLGLDQFLNDIGEVNCKLLRHFEIRWSNYVDIGIDLERDTKAARENMYQAKTSQVTTSSPSPSTNIPTNQWSFHSPFNPTTTTRHTARTDVSVSGIPAAGYPDFWEKMGTAQFCSTLADVLSRKLGQRASENSLVFSKDALIDFVTEVDEHASGLRWLWFW